MKEVMLACLRENLADWQHRIWSHWMKYMFTQCAIEKDASGNVVSCFIPADKVERWMRQANTDYNDLSEAEKDSDREQVDKFFHLLEERIE